MRTIKPSSVKRILESYIKEFVSELNGLCWFLAKHKCVSEIENVSGDFVGDIKSDEVMCLLGLGRCIANARSTKKKLII